MVAASNLEALRRRSLTDEGGLSSHDDPRRCERVDEDGGVGSKVLIDSIILHSKTASIGPTMRLDIINLSMISIVV